MRLSNRQLAAYSAPALPIAALSLPLVIYMPPFYAMEMGLGLTAVGTIVMAARFWDLLTDPAMGIISDKFPSRWGRRRHWIVLSVPALMISAVLVMFPNWFPASHGSSAYLISSLFLLYVGFTMLTISHMSWGAELTDDYNERSRVQGWREFAHLTSIVIVMSIPAVLEQTGYALSNTLKMNAIGWYVLALTPLAIWIAVSRVGETPVKPAPRIPLKQALGVLVANRYLLRILVADLFIHIPGSVRASTFIFYVAAVIGMPEWAAIILLSYAAAGPIAVPVWVWISNRMSKHKACALGVLLHVIVSACYLIPGPGDALLFAALFFTSGLVYSGVPFMIRSMVADVVDHDRVETGQDRTGLYFSTVTMTHKVGGALGIGLGYPLLALVGFDPIGENSASQIDGLRYVFAFTPVVTELLVVMVLLRYPLDRNVQLDLRAKLASRDAGTGGATEPAISPRTRSIVE